MAPTGLALGVLEADEPADVMAIEYLSIGGAPRAHLQIVKDRSSLGQGGEPGA
jgi:hypothetical protein